MSKNRGSIPIMIARLKGTIVDIAPTHVTLDVGDIGYLIAITTHQDFKIDQEVELFTHLAVRETALDLYGFLTKEEKNIFQLLLKLPKIGPKSAMQILSQADIPLLKKAVAGQDATYLSKMSGIGGKTAEKIIVGLKDSFEDIDENPFEKTDMSRDGDVIDALMALGYTQKDAREALQKISPEIADTNEKIKEILKLMGS